MDEQLNQIQYYFYICCENSIDAIKLDTFKLPRAYAMGPDLTHESLRDHTRDQTTIVSPALIVVLLR